MMKAATKRICLVSVLVLLGFVLWTRTDHYHLVQFRISERMISIGGGMVTARKSDIIFMMLCRAGGRNLEDWTYAWQHHIDALQHSGYFHRYTMAWTNRAVAPLDLLKQANVEFPEEAWNTRFDSTNATVTVRCRPEFAARWKTLVSAIQSDH
jgi:hypothetical protein